MNSVDQGSKFCPVPRPSADLSETVFIDSYDGDNRRLPCSEAVRHHRVGESEVDTGERVRIYNGEEDENDGQGAGHAIIERTLIHVSFVLPAGPRTPCR